MLPINGVNLRVVRYVIMKLRVMGSFVMDLGMVRCVVMYLRVMRLVIMNVGMVMCVVMHLGLFVRNIDNGMVFIFDWFWLDRRPVVRF